MCAFITLEDFIIRASAHKFFTIIMQTMQVTQAMSFLKAKPKTILDIGCDHIAPSMTVLLSIDALHLQRPMHN
jgi:hypothetical protein